MAFDGVLSPESASFAGQAAISRSLAYQNTPERLLHRFPSQGPQVPPPVGKREWPARSAVQWSPCGESDLRAGDKGCPDLCQPLPSPMAHQRGKKGTLTSPPLVRCAGAPCEAGAAGPAPQRVVPGSQPTQCHTLGLARGSGPFEPPTGGVSPWPPITPLAAFREAAAARSTTTARAPPSERKALGWLKSRATWTRHRGLFGGALLYSHRLDPQRRKLSTHPATAETTLAFDGGSITPPPLLWHGSAPATKCAGRALSTCQSVREGEGRSRQGDPARMIQRIPAVAVRLSLSDRPGSPFFPGSSGSMSFHYLSVSIRLDMVYPVGLRRVL